jgi:hypothetical protein
VAGRWLKFYNQPPATSDKLMTTKLKISILILLLVPVAAVANPFRSYYVCIPTLDPSASPLEFHIREGQDCKEGEHLAQVVPQKDGSIFLLPTQAPLSPEGQKELEEYKKYYGIDH